MFNRISEDLMYRISVGILMLISFFLSFYALVIFPVRAGLEGQPWFSPIVAAVSFCTLAICAGWENIKDDGVTNRLFMGTVRAAVFTTPLYCFGLWFGDHI